MDPKFLEFWGNCLLNLSKLGQVPDPNRFQEEALRFWGSLLSGNKGTGQFNTSEIFEKQLELFRKCYGLEEKSREPEFIESFKKASGEFQRSFQEFMSVFDFVPREDYEQLKRKTEELNEKVREQNEIIRQLRIAKISEGAEEIAAASGIQEMIKNQTEQFSTLMDALGSIYGSTGQGKPEQHKKK